MNEVRLAYFFVWFLNESINKKYSIRKHPGTNLEGDCGFIFIYWPITCTITRIPGCRVSLI